MRSLPLLLLIAVCSPADITLVERDFGSLFQGFEGTFVLIDESDSSGIVHNAPRSTHRYSPFSTFKIANSVVALETGVISDVDSVFRWDTTRYPPEQWWPKQWQGTHTMRSAITYSVVPFYREVARRVGSEKMQRFIDRFAYGNQDISSGTDDFWLNGSLRISAREQATFLQQLYHNAFGVSEETLAAVQSILVQEENERYRLSAKTGTGTGFDTTNPKRALAWYVGVVEKDQKRFFFAMNIEGDTFNSVLTPRIEIARTILTELKILE